MLGELTPEGRPFVPASHLLQMGQASRRHGRVFRAERGSCGLLSQARQADMRYIWIRAVQVCVYSNMRARE